MDGTETPQPNAASALTAGPAGVGWTVVRYAQIPMVASGQARRATIARLAQLAQVLEVAFGSAQDVEGAFANQVLYVVQSRPIAAPD